MKRASVIGAAVTAILLVNGGAGVAARAASPLDPVLTVAPNMVEFNLAGWQQNNGNVAPADRLVAAVTNASPRPVAVALSEVCSSADITKPGQWQRVQTGLAALGYASFFAPSTTSPLGPRCDSFGNAVALLGIATSTSRTYATQFPTTTSERRNIVCARGFTPVGELAACSTHLVPNRSTNTATEQQASEALQWVQATFTAVPRLVGGDFNLRAADLALDGWYSDSYEGDASNRIDPQATRDSGIKNDYVFANKASFAANSTAIVTSAAESDHHLYEAHFQHS